MNATLLLLVSDENTSFNPKKIITPFLRKENLESFVINQNLESFSTNLEEIVLPFTNFNADSKETLKGMLHSKIDKIFDSIE